MRIARTGRGWITLLNCADRNGSQLLHRQLAGLRIADLGPVENRAWGDIGLTREPHSSGMSESVLAGKYKGCRPPERAERADNRTYVV